MEITQEMLVSIAGIISTVGGAWLVIRKISKDNEKEKALQAAKILQAAKEALSVKEKELNEKLNALDVRIDNLEANVNKDLDHIRETYNGEIRNLGQKIEDLRNELRTQHGSLVQLLSKLIDQKD